MPKNLIRYIFIRKSNKKISNALGGNFISYIA